MDITVTEDEYGTDKVLLRLKVLRRNSAIAGPASAVSDGEMPTFLCSLTHSGDLKQVLELIVAICGIVRSHRILLVEASYLVQTSEFK